MGQCGIRGFKQFKDNERDTATVRSGPQTVANPDLPSDQTLSAKIETPDPSAVQHVRIK